MLLATLTACGSPVADQPDRPVDQVIPDAALGLDETDGSRLTGVEELRAAGVSVNGLA